jgi:hypothetical protein
MNDRELKIERIDQDIDVVFLTADNFPHDVPDAYQVLNTLIPYNPSRRYFGISQPDRTGAIQYKAAAEILPMENISNPKLMKFTITKGIFVSLYIINHFKDSKSISNAFEQLLQHPKLDPNGYCLEVYKDYSDVDVQCMVRIIT